MPRRNNGRRRHRAQGMSEQSLERLKEQLRQKSEQQHQQTSDPDPRRQAR